MSTKRVIFQATKDNVKPEYLPILTEEVRKLIQRFLFHWLRDVNDNLERTLKENSQKTAELLAKYPNAQYWTNPSDSELKEKIINQTHDDVSGRGGWEYSVKEEGMFVNGILKIFVKGHRTMPIQSSYTLDEFPGLRVSEEVKNED